jgi:hypothetical protein
MSKFAAYLIGVVLFVAGLAFALNLAGLPNQWIMAAALIAIGIGVAVGATHTKRDDPPQV